MCELLQSGDRTLITSCDITCGPLDFVWRWLGGSLELECGVPQGLTDDPLTRTGHGAVPTLQARVVLRRATGEHHRAQLARRVRTRQHPTEPVVGGPRGAATAIIEQCPDVSELRWVDDRFPPLHPHAGLPDDGGGAEKAAQPGGRDVQSIGDLVQGDATEKVLHGLAEYDRLGFVDDQALALAPVPERRVPPVPQPTLRPISVCAFDATARVIARLLGYRHEDSCVELSVVCREVDVPLSGDDACEVYFLRSIDDVLQFAWLAQQPIKVVGDHRVRLSKLAEHLLEHRPVHVGLVGGEVVVFEPADWVFGPTLTRDRGYHIVTLPRHPRP